MRIVIAGGHGQIALRLERLLAGRGDEVAGIVRRPEQAGDLLAAGAEPVVCDLESASVEDVTRHMEGADAAVFAAGAGPGSGTERKETVDRGAARLFADAAEAAGVRRFLVISSMGADREPPRAPTRSSPPTCGPRPQPTRTSAPGPAWTGRSCGPAG